VTVAESVTIKNPSVGGYVRILLQEEIIIMKLKIYIILTILLSACFGYAQPKLITREELDKREVTEFIDEFTKSYNTTKDLRTMPSKYFAKNFKDNMVKTSDALGIEDEMTDISVDQRFEYGILIRQLAYFSYRNTLSYESRGLPISDYRNYQSFPPDVLEILKASKVLIEIFDIEVEEKSDDEDDDKITSADIVKSIEIMQNAIALFKVYDDNQEPLSDEMVKEISELEESSYEVERCENQGQCFGMPEKTRIYWVVSNTLCK
jgi:hypothetical protein